MFRRLDRYIAASVARPMLAIAGVLILVFASFDTARTLADFEANGLGPLTLAKLVGLKSLIALDVLLPLALYLAAVVGLAHLHRNQEMTALRSIGTSPLRTSVGLLGVALGLAAMVAIVGLFARPWAYRQVELIETRLIDEARLSDLPADIFRALNDGGVLYGRRNAADSDAILDFFSYQRRNGSSQLILADRATEQPNADGRQLQLEGARSYRLDRDGPNDRRQTIDTVTWRFQPTSAIAEFGRKALSTAQLLGSRDPDEIAERQWRFSRPIAAILLALVAIPMSSSVPRQTPYARLTLALALFIVYFVLGDVARSWVEQAIVPPFPGLWWPHALLALGLIGAATASRPWRR